MPLGSGAGYGMVAVWFRKKDQSPEEFLENFNNLVVVQAIIVTVVWFLFNLIMREKPKNPPSAVAAVDYEPLDFKSAFKAIFENRNFMLLVIGFSLPFGAV